MNNTFEIKLEDDETLEYDDIFNVIAVPPAEPEGSRNAIATVTIKDDDGKLLIHLVFKNSHFQQDIKTLHNCEV